MTDQPRNPELGDAIDAGIDAFHEGIFTSVLARVESVDYAKQTVNAQPLVRRRFMRGDGRAGHERLPVVTGAPVMFPGAGGCGIRFPIPTGSTVLLVCLSHSTDRWLLVGREVDAEDSRKHTLNDVVAFPAGHAYAGPAKPQVKWLEDAMVIYAGAHELRLVTGTASEIVAINSELAALTAKYNDLVAKFNAHGHGYTTPGGPAVTTAHTNHVGVPAGSTAAAAAAATPAGSPRVKVP